MPTQQDIDYQKQQLQRYRAQARHYLGQRATLGQAFEPPGVAAGIAEAQREIARSKAALRRWGVAVEDLPEDDDGEDSQDTDPPWLTRTPRQPILQTATPFGNRFVCLEVRPGDVVWPPLSVQGILVSGHYRIAGVSSHERIEHVFGC